MRKTLSILMIVAIILISGCVLVPNKGDTKIEKKDVLDISLSVSPEKNIYEGTKIIANALITNVAQQPVTLYLKDNSKDTILIDHCAGIINIDKIMYYPNNNDSREYILKPHESINIIWHLNVNKGVSTKYPLCTLKFKFKYKAKAKTQSYIYFINPAEKLKDKYINKKMTLKGSNIATYGPVALSFTPLDKQPISSGQEWIANINVLNLKKGIAEIIGNVNIESPVDLVSCNPELNRIILYDQNPYTSQCVFNPVKAEILTPYKFVISAEYYYTEEFTKKIKILSRTELK